MPVCKICGKEYDLDEMADKEICLNCSSSMMQKDGIDIGMGEEFL